MHTSPHRFHIPVMGTGYSADTPIRVAHLGISSVISLVDDLLLERLRAHYSAQYALPYVPIPRRSPDGRARRITAYLEAVQAIVGLRLEALRAQPYGVDNDKARYFELLPPGELRAAYGRLLATPAGPDRDALAAQLDAQIVPGSIDVNIMVKLDRTDPDIANPGDEDSDALAAVRGFARSTLSSSLVLSAGINQRLFSHLTQYPDFYRAEGAAPRKGIVLKVSDFRSARIQGKLLAKKGLEVAEFRIESGLNCGGHAFSAEGAMLVSILREFVARRDELAAEFNPLVERYYTERGWAYPEAARDARPLLTVQGGIGTPGEQRRLIEYYGLDRTGWASPFLLVPEATCVDAATLDLLARAGADDIVLSAASPLGVPFSNLRGSGSERDRLRRIAEGRPGSPCPNGFAAVNTDLTERPVCLASRAYQSRRLAEIEALALPEADKDALRTETLAKACICRHLGNGALIALGLEQGADAPQAICPGPNLAWFSRTYTLREMVDHIYGRGPSLVPAERPHLFAAELALNVAVYAAQAAAGDGSAKALAALQAVRGNLEQGMADCLALAELPPFPGENLASLRDAVAEARRRLEAIGIALAARLAPAAVPA